MKAVDRHVGRFNLTPWRTMLAALAFLLCAVGVCVWIGVGGLWRAAGRWDDVWASGQFRLFAYVTAGSLAAGTLLVGYLVRAARRARVARGRAMGGQDGTAIIEFALVLPIALGIVLLMIQSSLLMGGFLCVNYASYCAARAAVVYVPATLSDEPANTMASEVDWEDSEKLARIRQAAIWAVMPISDGGYEDRSDYADVLAEGLADLFSQADVETPGWVEGYLGNKLAYAEQNTAVEISPPADGYQYAEHEDLRVTVSHNLYLSVPYAARVLAALDGDNAVDFGEGRYALRVHIPCTLTNEGVPDTIDLEPDVEDVEERW